MHEIRPPSPLIEQDIETRAGGGKHRSFIPSFPLFYWIVLILLIVVVLMVVNGLLNSPH